MNTKRMASPIAACDEPSRIGHPPSARVRPPGLDRPAAVLAAALLAACGGGEGGSDTSQASETSVSSATAMDTAADTVVIATETMNAVDVVVLSAEEVMRVHSASAPTESARALAIALEQPSAVVSVPVSCPGGGSATIGISGGTPATLVNGKPDAGEIYAVNFTQCQWATGAPAVNGGLTMTVVSADGTTAQLSMELASLSVHLSRGTVALAGAVSWKGSSHTVSPTTTTSSELQVANLGMTTAFGTRTSTFELRSAQVARVSQWINGAPVSSAASGSYTIASARPLNAFEATVVTGGSTQYGADGTPTAGLWTMAFPTWSMQMGVTGGTVTLSIDQGKDGVVEKTYTTTPSALSADAG